MSESSLEKQNQYPISIYVVYMREMYYKYLAHAIMKANKFQYVQ